jgi:hypothetical protein
VGWGSYEKISLSKVVSYGLFKAVSIEKFAVLLAKDIPSLVPRVM